MHLQAPSSLGQEEHRGNSGSPIQLLEAMVQALLPLVQYGQGRKATTARTTLSTMAREETSGKTREENPGTARGATYVGITLQVRTGRI